MRYEQKRPSGLKRQIDNPDPPGVVEQRSAPVGAGDDKISSAGLIGNIGGQRSIADG
jgi:hypothetical protein